MEAAGVAVGVIGLAGLFSSVLDALDRLTDYRSFGDDSKTLHCQLQGYRALLESWGRNVGIEGAHLSADHRASLPPRTFSAAEQLLQIAKTLLVSDETSRNRARNGCQRSLDSMSASPRISKRKKLAWACGGKSEEVKRVGLLGEIVRQLTSLVPSEDEQGAQPKLEGLGEIRTMVHQMVDQMTKEREALVRKEVSAWLLGHAVANDRYQDSVKKRLQATCEWIFSRSEFVHWREGDFAAASKSILWINGHPGFGKTILCARIVEDLMRDGNTPVAHFFFSSELAARDDIYIAVRSWISQLASKYPPAFELVRDEWEIATEQTIISKYTAIQLLGAICRALPYCTLIVDGLDECAAAPDGQRCIETLLDDMRGSMAETTRLLVVSRDETSIRQALQDESGTDVAEIRISAEDVRGDTDLLSRHIVDRRLPGKSVDVRESLSRSMSSRCDGQFLWIMMQELSLRRGMNHNDLKRAINETPTQLEQVYGRYWTAIYSLSARDQHRSLSLLRWAAFSLRPLTVCEMTEAVLLDENHDGISDDDVPDGIIDQDYIDTEIIGLCGPLLEVSCSSSDPSLGQRTVHIAHFTVKQFLIQQLPSTCLQANEILRLAAEQLQSALLGRLCLRYVRSRSSWGFIRHWSAPGLRGYFRNYAAEWWHSHLLSVGENELDPGTVQLAKEFMDESHPCWDFWRRWYDDHDQDAVAGYHRAYSPAPLVPLYYAIRIEFSRLAISIIHSRTGSIEEMDSGWTSFHQACRTGNSELVQAFLNAHAHADCRDACGFSPLHFAASEGRAEIAQLLIKVNANIATTNKYCSAPLHYATYHGHVEVVRQLLENGADPSALGRNDDRPLQIAAQQGHVAIVGLLLSFGADIAAADGSGWTCLHFAATQGHIAVIRLLLESGSKLAATSSEGWTPLHLAVEYGHFEVISYLLDSGLDISAISRHGWTALHVAVTTSHARVVQLLLERGADISAITSDAWAPIHVAAIWGSLEIIQLLLDMGAKTSVRDRRGMTPLMLAAQYRDVDAVQLLLRSDKNLIPNDSAYLPDTAQCLINQTDHHGRTALHFASQFGRTKTVQTLLTQGIDRMATSFYGSTALHTAVINGHTEVVKALLASKKFSLDLRDGHGRPLAWWASRSRDPNVERVLREHAKQSNVELQMEDITAFSSYYIHSSYYVSSSMFVGWCDACTLSLAHGAQVSICRICDDGGFCLCVECVSVGLHCRDKNHSLVLRTNGS